MIIHLMKLSTLWRTKSLFLAKPSWYITSGGEVLYLSRRHPKEIKRGAPADSSRQRVVTNTDLV
ncbi:hypothetical protein GQ607_015086 [Colletotrichum asianum]|uniref:Uncharacterized protein n=1 Tax=Colletotrichum asianum TaxID=702518 RepID=A0A8H3W1N7_9PEZI|nr:hypothetical protein GQ607_015086 [Colletotrichum asianum]